MPKDRFASRRAYRERNPERIKAYDKTYHACHLAEHAARQRRYYHAADPERKRIRAREKKTGRASNPQKDKAYRALHLEARLANNKKRRALKSSAPLCDLTAAQWRLIKDHYNHRCVYCHKTFKRLTQDHITPLSRGGSHTLSNIVPACLSCNAQKGARDVLVAVQPMFL